MERRMTYDEIQHQIAQLRAELAGSFLTRKERRDAQAELARGEAEATKHAAIIDAEDFADC